VEQITELEKELEEIRIELRTTQSQCTSTQSMPGSCVIILTHAACMTVESQRESNEKQQHKFQYEHQQLSLQLEQKQQALAEAQRHNESDAQRIRALLEEQETARVRLEQLQVDHDKLERSSTELRESLAALERKNAELSSLRTAAVDLPGIAQWKLALTHSLTHLIWLQSPNPSRRIESHGRRTMSSRSRRRPSPSKWPSCRLNATHGARQPRRLKASYTQRYDRERQRNVRRHSFN